MITAETDLPTNPDAAAESTEQTHCVPLSALAVEGATPEAGDAVEYTVKGRIARIEGAEAYVTPETINDQPATLPPEPTEDGEGDMMAMAKKADEENPGY